MAKQVTWVLPTGKSDPDWWSQFTFGAGSTTSVAQVGNVTKAPFGPVALTWMSGRSHSTGGVVSRTRTTNVAVGGLNALSVARHEPGVSGSRSDSAREPGGPVCAPCAGTGPPTD